MHARTQGGAEPAAVRRRTPSARFSEAAGRRGELWEAKAGVGRGAGKAEGRVAPRAGRPTRECGLAAGKAPAAAGPEPASEEAGGDLPRLRGGRRGRAWGQKGGPAPEVRASGQWAVPPCERRRVRHPQPGQRGDHCPRGHSSGFRGRVRVVGSTYRLDQHRILQQAGKTPADGTAAHTSLPSNRCRDLGSGAPDQAVLLRGAGQAVFGLCVRSPWMNDCVERKKEDLRGEC